MMRKNGIVAALLIGRGGSVGWPGKNVSLLLGRPLMSYPLMAALNSKYVDEVYISTDSEEIKKVASQYKVSIIDRPKELATKEALAEDAFVHGYRSIVKTSDKEIELMVLLYCNAPTILSKTIDEGIEILRRDPSLDSVATVSVYNMWSPVRARRINEEGLLEPFIPFEYFENLGTITCDRDSQGDVYFADSSMAIVYPRCLEDLSYGVLPFRYLGRRIYPLKQWGGCDLDYRWQVPSAEYWLREHGFSEKETPYEIDRKCY